MKKSILFFLFMFLGCEEFPIRPEMQEMNLNSQEAEQAGLNEKEEQNSNEQVETSDLRELTEASQISFSKVSDVGRVDEEVRDRETLLQDLKKDKCEWFKGVHQCVKEAVDFQSIYDCHYRYHDKYVSLEEKWKMFLDEERELTEQMVSGSSHYGTMIFCIVSKLFDESTFKVVQTCSLNVYADVSKKSLKCGYNL